ncbi:MAG: hypothetical protein ACLFQK_01975 [Fibrobacterota bacterium]
MIYLRSRLFFLVIFLCIISSAAEKPEPGVDWVNRTVTAIGVSGDKGNRASKIRVAKLTAIRDALELVKGMPVNSTTTVKNLMLESDVIKTKINGYIQNFEFENKPHYMSDGTIEIAVTIPLDGIMDQLVPSEIGDNPSVKSMESTSAPGAVFTGMIIDASGLEVKPAIAPKIIDEDGKEIYGSAYVSREFAVKYGMAGYARTLDQARINKDRIGEKPAVFKATEALGANKCDIRISNTQADQIRSAAENLKFLEQCRVIIIL